MVASLVWVGEEGTPQEEHNDVSNAVSVSSLSQEELGELVVCFAVYDVCDAKHCALLCSG